MLAKRLLSLAVLAASLASVALTADAGAASKSARLKAFSSCSSLIGYGNRFAPRSAVPVFTSSAPAPEKMSGGETGGGSTGGGEMSPAAPAPASGDQQQSAAAAPAAPERGTDFSGTNTQEENVDEPDIVKTDGSTVFAVANRKLHAVDVSSGATKLLSSLDLPEAAWTAELLISGKRALLMWNTSDYGGGGPMPTDMPMARPASSMVPGALRTETVLAEVDISDPAAMKIVRSATIDGRLVTSRLNGTTARVITAATPRALEVPIDYSLPAEQQRAALAEAGSPQARKWLPRRGWRTGISSKRRFKRAVACDDVRRPAVFSGLDMVTVLTIDLSKGITPVDSDALMTDAETVYASDKSLYIGTRKWIRAVDAPLPDPSTGEPPAIRTQLHKFDISDAQSTTYKGSGDVTGYLLNQFSLSEHEGVLRVATTDGPSWWPGPVGQQSESAVTTLETKAGGVLGTVGRVGGLGKGERIYAVRFIGDKGYVVTFRQTDPLYTIDVSNPANPRVAGELKILGYSAYLHPLAGNLLIGVGQDATEEGRRTGAQISLFDVSDPANPTRLHQRSLGQYSSSDAEHDHHAFLYWPATNLLMLPVSTYSERESFSGAMGFRVKRDTGIQEIARISHPGADYLPQVTRSMVIGDRVFTMSPFGLKASTLDTLADAGWVAFPTP